jgi:hypothetical protein
MVSRDVPTPADMANMDMIAAALDPNAIRRAIWQYGFGLDFPGGKCPPIPMRAGKEAWKLDLKAADSVSLGLAWIQIGEKETARMRLFLLKQAEETKKEDKMPFINPTKSMDPGIYPAKIATIEEVEGTYEGKKTHSLLFTFAILDQAGGPTEEEMRGYCGYAWSKGSRLYEWAPIIMGKRLDVSQPFDYDRLLNRKVDIGVEMNKAGTWPQIVAVYGYQTMSKAKPETDDDDDEAKAEAPF